MNLLRSLIWEEFRSAWTQFGFYIKYLFITTPKSHYMSVDESVLRQLCSVEDCPFYYKSIDEDPACQILATFLKWPFFDQSDRPRYGQLWLCDQKVSPKYCRLLKDFEELAARLSDGEGE